MKKVKVFSSLLIFLFFVTNTSVGLGSRHFIRVGAQELFAANMYCYDKYYAGYGYTDTGNWHYDCTDKWDKPNPNFSGLYMNYSVNSSNGYFVFNNPVQNPQWGTVYYYGWNDKLFKYVPGSSSGGYWYWYSYYQTRSDLVYLMIPLYVLQTNIIAQDGTYPNNGLHSDGYWYKKGDGLPTLTVNSPSQNGTLFLNPVTIERSV